MAQHDDELQQERGVNQQYMFTLQQMIKEYGGIARQITSLPRNSQFHGTAVAKGRGPLIEPFAGKVVLTEEDDDLGSGFYIGSYRLDLDDLQVISFAAPMARLFYLGRAANVDIADSLAGRRTFDRTSNDLVDFEDEIEPGAPHDPFAATTKTSTPVDAAPRPAKRPTVAPPPAPVSRPAPAPVPPAATPSEVPQPAPVPRPATGPLPTSPTSGGPDSAESPDTLPAAPTTVSTSDAADEVSPSPASSSSAGAVPERISRLRAPKTVLTAVTAPRTGRLKSLLATLQPQQYELVTWPEEDHLIIQGHPGTGKTVIALHRAAYLTDPERLPPDRRAPAGAVLVIGPTTAYIDHVKPLLSDIAQPEWAVWSLAHFYAQLGDFRDPNLPTDPDRVATSAEPLGETVDRALSSYRGPGTVRDFTQFLFTDSKEMREAALHDREVLAFLSGGKNHEYARNHSRYHPLLALAGLTISGVSLADRFRHVIVDEAQDLRPIDLKMLAMLVSHGVTLTLVGDMNQRRSDFTHDSWAEVAAELRIANADGAPPLVTIETGFRSTNQILRYASGLLTKSERGATALRDGPAPAEIRCTAGTVAATALRSADQLAERLSGLTAIITMDPKGVSDHFRSKGWRRGTLTHSWRRTQDSPNVLVLHPDMARGLEFDGVVVVEPADFPAIIGRHGVLYTSLTRATKELVVVHTKALPRELRSR